MALLDEAGYRIYALEATAMLLVLLAACAGPLQGYWLGDCSLSSDTRDVDLTLTMYLSDGPGSTLSGSADIEDHDFVYQIEGQQLDDKVGLTLHGTLPAQEGDTTTEAWIVFAGSLQGEALKGSGEYWTTVTQGEQQGESEHFTGCCTFDQGD